MDSFLFSEPHTCDTIDKAALRAWQRDGVLKMTGLVSQEWVAYGRERVREKLGAEPEEASAWANLKSGALKPLGLDAQCVSIDTEPVRSAVDALIGEGWKRPKSGGSWFCNAPTQDTIEPGVSPSVPRGNWHWDNRPDLCEPGLWVFTPLTKLEAHLGGTWLAAGSYHRVLDFYKTLAPEQRGKRTKQVKKWFAKAHPWFAALNGDEPLEFSEEGDDAISLMSVSGAPGDIVFMRDFTIHSIPATIGPGPRVCHVITTASDRLHNNLL